VPEKKVVLIVSNDLGFLCWLGFTLGMAGHRALPAKGVAEAERLLEDFNLQVDVLIIDPALEGAGALAQTLRWSPNQTRTIAVATGKSAGFSPLSSPFDVFKALPEQSSAQAAESWIQSVEAQLEANLKPVFTF